jgi:tetratricopeptide (TPR) repeat protein
MLGIASSLSSVALLLLLAAPAMGQRDRDTYNPNNQAFEVSGVVSLADTGAAAQNVPVRLEKFSGGIIDQMSTDTRGRFRFINLQRNYYKVVINTPGFNAMQQDADLQVLFKVFLVFELARDKSRDTTGRATLNDIVDARVPAEARDEFDRGRAALAKKEQQEAIAHLQKAINLYPSFFDADLLLATAYIDLRDWSKAEAVLRRAIELKPESAPAIISLGEVYWRQKRLQESEETLLVGLKLDDKSWHGQFTLARLYCEMGDIKKAGPPLGKTLQLKPDFAEAHLLAGNVLLKVGQQRRALLEYEEYLKLAPKGEFAPQARELVQKLQKALGETR